MTRDELDILVSAYGCPESVVPTAVAVILAESGGDPNAMLVNTGGTRPGSIDRGLWQINDYWHSEVSDECAFDAVCSTKEAARISKQWTDFSPWNAYKSGAYLKYLEKPRMYIARLKTVYYTPALKPKPPLGIVLHNTVTAMPVDPHNQGSWHYDILRDGMVRQWVNDMDYAWHVRACDEWRPHWIEKRSNTVSEANSCTVGIELVSLAGSPTEPPGYQAYTDAQYASLYELLRMLYDLYGRIPIVTHGSLQLDRTDPVRFDPTRVGLEWAGDGYRLTTAPTEDPAVIEQLQAQLQAMTGERDQLNGINTELQNQVDALRTEIGGLNGVNSELQGQVDALRTEVLGLNAELEACRSSGPKVVKEYPVASRVVVVFPDGHEMALPSAP